MGLNGNNLEPLAPGEAYVSSTLVSVLGIEAGGTFHLAFKDDDISAVFKGLAEHKGIEHKGLDAKVSVPLKLKEYRKNFIGRFFDNDYYTKVVLLDIKTFMTYMKPYMKEALSEAPEFGEMVSN